MPTATTATVPGHTDAPPRVSVEEFVARHNGEHVELVGGIVKEIPVPGLEHGKVCAQADHSPGDARRGPRPRPGHE